MGVVFAAMPSVCCRLAGELTTEGPELVEVPFFGHLAAMWPDAPQRKHWMAANERALGSGAFPPGREGYLMVLERPFLPPFPFRGPLPLWGRCGELGVEDGLVSSCKATMGK